MKDVFGFPRFASVYSVVNEYLHCWEGTCDGLVSCPGVSTRALLRLERTMNSVCHLREGGKGEEGRGVPLVILAIFCLNISVARY